MSGALEKWTEPPSGMNNMFISSNCANKKLCCCRKKFTQTTREPLKFKHTCKHTYKPKAPHSPNKWQPFMLVPRQGISHSLGQTATRNYYGAKWLCNTLYSTPLAKVTNKRHSHLAEVHDSSNLVLLFHAHGSSPSCQFILETSFSISQSCSSPFWSCMDLLILKRPLDYGAYLILVGPGKFIQHLVHGFTEDPGPCFPLDVERLPAFEISKCLFMAQACLLHMAVNTSVLPIELLVNPNLLTLHVAPWFFSLPALGTVHPASLSEGCHCCLLVWLTNLQKEETIIVNGVDLWILPLDWPCARRWCWIVTCGAVMVLALVLILINLPFNFLLGHHCELFLLNWTQNCSCGSACCRQKTTQPHTYEGLSDKNTIALSSTSHDVLWKWSVKMEWLHTKPSVCGGSLSSCQMLNTSVQKQSWSNIVIVNTHL